MPNNIKLLSRRNHSVPAGAITISRPHHPLGTDYTVGWGRYTYAEAANLYEKWFFFRLGDQSSVVYNEIIRMYNIWVDSKDGEIVLVCGCPPARCHGDTIVYALSHMNETLGGRPITDDLDLTAIIPPPENVVNDPFVEDDPRLPMFEAPAYPWRYKRVTGLFIKGGIEEKEETEETEEDEDE